jgi:signal peptidase I
MRRTRTWVCGAAFLLAVLAIAAGCSDESGPAQEPRERLIFTVRAGDMSPRLEINERVEFDLAAYREDKPTVGDIVLIRPPRGAVKERQCRSPRRPRPGQLCVKPTGGPAPEPVRFIKRVVALAGDRVRFRRGRVVRNGVLERRLGIRACPHGECTYRRAITVPAGHVYVAGDNRYVSDDSRFWGALPEDQLVGRYVRTVGTAGT